MSLVDRTLEAYRDRDTEIATQEQIMEIDQAYSRLFSTDDGKFVLRHLAKMNLTNAIAFTGDTLLDIGIKQGRANIVNEIIQRIERQKLGS